MSSSSRMPASVVKSQSAFEFYRKLEMANIKATIPANSPLGAVMTAVSQTWKSLPPASKAKYEALAAKDKLRFQNESAAADAAAEQIQQARRDNLDKQEGEGMDRGARGKMIEARVDRDNAAERRKEREAMIDPEVSEYVIFTAQTQIQTNYPPQNRNLFRSLKAAALKKSGRRRRLTPAALSRLRRIPL